MLCEFCEKHISYLHNTVRQKKSSYIQLIFIFIYCTALQLTSSTWFMNETDMDYAHDGLVYLLPLC
jgi:hypothetical protein